MKKTPENKKATAKLGAKYDPTKKKMPAAPSTMAQIKKRYNVTAREARDIATALGTVAVKRALLTGGGDTTAKGKDIKNLKKQISETVTAAKTGKRGTSSDIEGRKIEKPYGSGRYKVDFTYGYEKGTQRGKGGKARKLSQ